MNKIVQMMEYMIQDVVEIITEVQGLEYDQAMYDLYNSQTYDHIMISTPKVSSMALTTLT